MVKSAEQKELDKLHNAYNKAEYALIKKRDELFPVGTVVYSRLQPDLKATVQDGSLYADQVNTNIGHMSWWFLEKTGEEV